LEELSAYSGEDNLTIRNVLGELVVSSDDVYKKIAVLSGGETSRFAGAKLMLTKSNCCCGMTEKSMDFASKEVFEAASRIMTERCWWYRMTISAQRDCDRLIFVKTAGLMFRLRI
jgi:hypothetical protein